MASTADEKLMEQGDTEVFEALAEAQKQYEQYLEVTKISDLTQVWSETPVLPPAPDLPLSFTIWREK